eukprot:CAMPEP_0198205430 /NCGR_PEP_ID=MMETSP1445-20131203/8967_1 /TAXON_ID=36898 /ORGANISM="Pyramimonas sp., Strain CCMP2087" /LENGTH=357 /DNA_ID=CAMNT_0043877739 /DNA_START=697 /DNA_END=1770 /DNA_ORIENTATION=-
MTVIVLKDGSLFVHAPVAPTIECLRLVDELGPVKYVVLPTTAVEHKVFFGPFCKRYPASQIYAAPGQWSLPLNLPLSFLGLWPRKLDGVLKDADKSAPWADEFEQALLYVPLGLAPFVECAFYHRPTRTLLVTDTVIALSSTPPIICQDNPESLLIRAKDDKNDPALDTLEVRQRGWQKIVLFSLFIKPGYVDVNILDVLAEALRAGPFADCFIWNPKWKESFDNVQQHKLVCPPILQTLVLNKQPTLVKEWVAKVCKWDFQRVIPAHFTAPVAANSRDFANAFRYLDKQATQTTQPSQPSQTAQSVKRRSWLPRFGWGKNSKDTAELVFDEKDMEVFTRANAFLTFTGAVKGEKLP